MASLTVKLRRIGSTKNPEIRLSGQAENPRREGEPLQRWRDVPEGDPSQQHSISQVFIKLDQRRRLLHEALPAIDSPLSTTIML